MLRIAVSLALAVTALGCSQADEADTSTATSGESSRVVIPVTGMHCGGCASNLHRMAKDCTGVREANASFEDGQVVVLMDPGASLNPLLVGIASMGWTTPDHPLPPDSDQVPTE